MQKTILVTGAMGQIGSRLVPHLRSLLPDIRVIASDIFVKNESDYVVCNILHSQDIEQVYKYAGGSIDYVIHMAAKISRLYGEEHPNDMVETNTLGTLNIVRACVERGSRLLNFSTSEVYGDLLLDKDIVTEDDFWNLSALRLTNVYGMSKYFAETLVKHYVANYGLQAVSVRPFMVYGSEVPSKYKSALSRFVHGALSGEGFEVHRGGKRAWCHIDDFINAIRLIIEQHNFESDEYAVYDIGVDDYRDMEDIARLVLVMTGSNEKIMNVVESPGFLSLRKHASFSAIRKLGFKQKISLEEGLQRLIDWYKILLSH